MVFPVVHGPLYEDGSLQGVLRLAGIPYVGCDVLASAIGMDKDMTRRVACLDDIACAKYKVLSWHMNSHQRSQACDTAARELGFPLFVKPCALGSSVGIHKANTMSELQAAVDDAMRYDETVLIEGFIKGREIEVAVLESRNPTDAPRVSVAGEILVHHPDGFYSYTAKYLESSQTDLDIPAVMDSALMQQLQQDAANIFTRLKCKGLARIDFFINDETRTIYFNEINTLPGFTSISMYPKMWAASGLPYEALLDELIALALMHGECQKHLVTSYQ